LRDYRAWHRQYADPDSSLAQRLRVVQQRLDGLLAEAPPGSIRVISMCAGQGHDLIGVLPGHPRQEDVQALLVELDGDNVGAARDAASDAHLRGLTVIQADAAMSDVYAAHVPADVLLACGIFGNVSDSDVERTVRNLSMLCRTGTSVIWTRHRGKPDLTPAIRRWFGESGFAELSFDALENETRSGVGTARLVGKPLSFAPGFRFFTFVR
jgi:hypothetical protein